MPKRKKERPIKRPYATHYYVGVYDAAPTFSSQGFAASDRGAIRASVVRIFMDEYAKAVIYDRHTGLPLYTVKRSSAGISVHYGSGESAKLHRVK